MRGLVIAHGRRGTRVAPRPPIRARPLPPPPPLHPSAARAPRDLTIGLADPQLLPALEPALAKVARMPRTPFERLGSAHVNLKWFARGWFAADGIAASPLAVLAGALDGLERVLSAHLRIGDRVLIEDPANPSVRDLLLALGLVACPVAVDERGLVPAALAEGLARGAHALVYVPRGQNPTGAALDHQRAVALRAVLAADPDLLVIEDDHVSLVSGAPLCSALAPARSRWAIVRSLSKLLHPDLRVALVAGDETTIARVEGRQALGPRWVSQLLQETAATMLTDVRFQARCAAAAAAYSERRQALIGALAQRNIRSVGNSGLNVWVPVHEEAPVVRALGDAGFLVLAGERFRIASPPAIRITAATLRDGEAEQIATALADALERSGGQLGRFEPRRSGTRASL
jgi:DNA-binding transcriptional MocR family regulator